MSKQTKKNRKFSAFREFFVWLGQQKIFTDWRQAMPQHVQQAVSYLEKGNSPLLEQSVPCAVRSSYSFRPLESVEDKYLFDRNARLNTQAIATRNFLGLYQDEEGNITPIFRVIPRMWSRKADGVTMQFVNAVRDAGGYWQALDRFEPLVVRLAREERQRNAQHADKRRQAKAQREAQAKREAEARKPKTKKQLVKERLAVAGEQPWKQALAVNGTELACKVERRRKDRARRAELKAQRAAEREEQLVDRLVEAAFATMAEGSRRDFDHTQAA